jgi:phosphohistidine phosphatase SixA
MLVGHMPSLPRIFQALVGNDTAAFPQHGIVALDVDGDKWMEKWRME